jgi:plastocyanin
MKFHSLLLALTALVAGVPNSLAETLEYVVDPWAPPDPWGEGYPTINVYPGDTLTFNWPWGVEYNVWQHPSLTCDDETNASLVGASSGAKYTFAEWEGTPEGKQTLFVCNLHDYCEQGMSVRVNIFSGAAPAPISAPWADPTLAPTAWVAPPTYAPTYPNTESPTYYVAVTESPTYYVAVTESPTSDVADTAEPTIPVENDPPIEVAKEVVIENWDIPADGQPFPPVEANVGDTIKFVVNPGHDVYIHPSLSCDDKTEAIFVGSNTIPAEYTIQKADAGRELMFVCEVGAHCSLGMQITVVIGAFQSPEGPPVDEEAIEIPELPVSDEEIEVAAKDIPIEWSIPADGQPFDPVQATVGDTITFSMGPGHNVHIHPSGSCDQTGRVFLGEDTTTTYTFLPEDEGKTKFFACDVGTHCDLGMQIQVTVSGGGPPFTGDSDIGDPFVEEADLVQAKEIIVDNWTRPESGEVFDPIEANVGDTIIFSWEDNQNVFIHPSKNCDPTFSIFVGVSSPAAYTFQSSDGSPEGKDHLFVSDVGSNCELGMQLLVKVFSSSEVTSDGSSQSSPVSSGTGAVKRSVLYSYIGVPSLAVVMLGWMF